MLALSDGVPAYSHCVTGSDQTGWVTVVLHLLKLPSRMEQDADNTSLKQQRIGKKKKKKKRTNLAGLVDKILP